jgi:hypothetical protein
MADDLPIGAGPFGEGNRDAANAVIRAALGEAVADGGVAVGHLYQDPEPGQPNAQGIEPGKWEPDPETGLPSDLPVTILGYDGNVNYIFTYRGVVEGFSGKGLNEVIVGGWFSPRSNYLCWMCPPPPTSTGKDPRNPKNFQFKEAAILLANACSVKGPWSPLSRLRGVGGWRNDFGQLVFHFGDKVWTQGELRAPGEHEGVLYPRTEAMPRPTANPVSEAPGGGPDYIVQNFKRWAWSRPDAPLLMLGFLGCAMAGGALDWRPHCAVQGKRGGGKTLLQTTIRTLMGKLMLGVAKPSAAGITQMIGHSSRAVGIDEAENKYNARQMAEVIEMARNSSAGDAMPRGTQDGKGVMYTMRSSFFLTAINLPPFAPQDRQRFTIMNLRHHSQKTVAGLPEQNFGTLSEWGRQTLRRLVDNFARFDAVRAAFAQRLSLPVEAGGAGMEPRQSDQQYGHLIAMQHILMHDRAPSEQDLAFWVEHMRLDVATENENETDNWQDCLDYMMDKTPDAWRHKPSFRTVRQILAGVFEPVSDFSGVSLDGPQDYDALPPLEEGHAFKLDSARARLDDLGMALTFDGGQQTFAHAYLHIPSKHPGLSDLLEGSSWHTGPEATGVWHALLKQAPPEIIKADCNAKRGGTSRYGHKFALSALINLDLPQTARPNR